MVGAESAGRGEDGRGGQAPDSVVAPAEATACWGFTAWSRESKVRASVRAWRHVAFCLRAFPRLLPSFTRTPVGCAGLGPAALHLQRPYFQARSHLRFREGHGFGAGWGGDTAPLSTLSPFPVLGKTRA